jgi:hypothetical protein
VPSTVSADVLATLDFLQLMTKTGDDEKEEEAQYVVSTTEL